MSNNAIIPKKIKIDMLFNKLIVITIGILILVAIQIFLNLDFIETLELNKLITLIFCFLSIVDIIFLIVYPLILLIFQIDEKKIKKRMQAKGYTDSAILTDYTAALKFGKTKIGELCTYTHSFYHYYIIPNTQILSVRKQIKARTKNKVTKYNNGAIQRTHCTISNEFRYFINIVDIYHRSIYIHCYKETTANKIIEFYHKYSNIFFLDSDHQDSQTRRLLKERRKQLLEKERE